MSSKKATTTKTDSNASSSSTTTSSSSSRKKRSLNEFVSSTSTSPVVVVADVAVESTPPASIDNSPADVVDVVTTSIPRGRNVSGRDWKPVQRERKSSLFKGNRALRSFGERQQLRVMRDAVRAKSNELKAEADAVRAEEKAARAAKRKRKEENQAKNTVYQTITNVHKIRKMTKKQARSIRKVL